MIARRDFVWFWLLSLCVLLSADSSAADENAVHDSEFAHGIEESPIEDYEREHWSFIPLVRSRVPDVIYDNWPNNEIDCFILSKLERRDLKPSPPASRETVLRRLKFDLLGLPPTLDEIQEFVNDESEQAYSHLVDKFLASPGYGERWGQYWLDLARFAETDGFEHDKVRPDAWQYRQWIIDSLNSDMPYNQFVTLQLAGDLLSPNSDSIATSFCLAGPDMPDINEQDVRRHDKLNEVTATVGAALLGLQIGCAQCHDHKYDPISQADFYRLRAVFEPAIPLLQRDKPIKQLSRQTNPQKAYVYYRGELSERGPQVHPAPPRIACDEQCDWKNSNDDPRLAFATWMFGPNNPLVSRVIANRLWQYHFGKSLCGNPSDFGVVSSEPTHPELLDWLALEIQNSGWSLKQVHRKIVLSATYRQAGSANGLDSAAADDFQRCFNEDPENRLYGRFPRKRLEGEAIRDSLLAVADLIDRRYGGSSVMPPLPDELKQTLLHGQWTESQDASDHHRRSIYIFARRNLRYPIFEVFDRPDAGATCPQRNISTTALQSLQLLNSELAVTSAKALCQRILRETSPKRTQSLLANLFKIAYSRAPSHHEARLAAEFISQDDENMEDRLFIFCLAILNSNEFIYVD